MFSKLYHHPAVPILAFQLVLQAMLWQFGLSLVEAAVLVSVLSIVMPLVSLRARQEYRLAFRNPFGQRS